MSMERMSPFLRQKCASPCFSQLKHDFLLPPPAYQPKIRVRSLLGHCLYRRVIIWTVISLSLLCLMVYNSGGIVRTTTGGMLDFVELSKSDYWGRVIGGTKQLKASGTITSQPQWDGQTSRPEADSEGETKPAHWLKYKQ